MASVHHRSANKDPARTVQKANLNHRRHEVPQRKT